MTPDERVADLANRVAAEAIRILNEAGPDIEAEVTQETGGPDGEPDGTAMVVIDIRARGSS